MSPKPGTKIALITGGNAGIGLSVAERLLDLDSAIHICLVCRSKTRAEEAQEILKEKHPDADITLLLMDVSCLESVYKAAKAIKEQYHHIDYMYLNAGIMPVSTVDWAYFWKCLFSSKFVHMFRTGEGLLKQVDETTPEGLKKIFATNLFGHFALIRQLEDSLGDVGGRTTQIIWTSSSNAKKAAFMLSDIQHQFGHEPYASSKYAIDLVNVTLNEKLNQKGVYSHVVCPGLVMTNLTYGILPSWFWVLMYPLFLLLRLFVPSMNYSSFNGSEALVWLAKQPPQALDPRCKYQSCVSVLGNRYVKALKMDIDTSTAEKTYEKLCKMEKAIRAHYVK